MDEFANVSWQDNQISSVRGNTMGPISEPVQRNGGGRQIGRDADALDLAGVGEGVLLCTVTNPIKENDGTKDAYVSYLVTTNTNFPSFQKPVTKVRRRFTDFVFLYKTLFREYPASAVPPLPDKHKLEYVRGDRFGPDFTSRRANSLARFLTRLTLHPVLRRSALLIIFLESADWNATMKSRPQRGSSASEQSSVFDGFTDTWINAFTKVHKPDKRFIEVREKSDKLDEDLSHVEKIIARLSRRESDLETDFKDLAEQFQKLITLEPGVEEAGRGFGVAVEDMSQGMKGLRECTENDYLGSLRDMQAYSTAVKNLLKAREQKQLDFEQLTEYLNKSTSDRDILASSHGASSHTGAGGFIARKIEDVRGVDHEQSRRERLRKLELRIDELTGGVEEAKKLTEAFDEEVVREVADFERIKRVEFKDQLGGLADAHVRFFGGVIEMWEAYVKEMEAQGAPIARG